MVPVCCLQRAAYGQGHSRLNSIIYAPLPLACCPGGGSIAVSLELLSLQVMLVSNLYPECMVEDGGVTRTLALNRTFVNTAGQSMGKFYQATELAASSVGSFNLWLLGSSHKSHKATRAALEEFRLG